MTVQAHMASVGHVGPTFGNTIQDDFQRFHQENPQVYRELVRLARAWQSRRGTGKVGMKMLFEVLRWQLAMSTTGDDFKLNNNYTSYYARLVMAENPDLRGLFQTRVLAVAEPILVTS